ncbi:outer membrane protein assembly factor BamB [Candidatus Fukatsuia symbiotica]|uniref:Outer membrane protein assembly factor BamB n=1 Tax=Candidatus Fukatsuia symbiotica TaxID=1878942 RepID=A0A2U8I6R2_9GAMM|nr:outer membrane protein assembly factor BamB [Candidatus Fukatsuia symbiotica]AWK14787.1 outer membrane protein assembly factor BamB [Candidatus Fukatsuia symbiotica]MEA9445120.1 outer membrane protein assembly factor BamB [Candidatus Fukatsuia symbiotica]
MRLRKTLLSGLVSVIFLSGCSLLNSEDEMAVLSPLPKVTNQFTPDKMWSVSVGSGVAGYYSRLHPTWQGSSIFAADRKGLVQAMEVNSGKQIWRVNLAEKTHFLGNDRSAMLSGGLTVADSHLYVGSEEARVYALNTSDGKLVWQSAVAGEVLSRPVVSDDLLLIHTSNGMLQALNRADGTIKWTLNLDMPLLSLRGESTPTVAMGAAIVGGDNGRVSAVMIEQGQLIWQQHISQITGATEIDRLSDVDMSPVVVEGIVYALAYNGNLTALDLRSGQILWQREMGSVDDFIVNMGRIYLVDQNDRIMALQSNGGVTVWNQSDLLHRNLTSPAMYNNYLVVGDSKGYLHWLNKEDGRFVAQQQVDSSGFLSTPLVVDNKLIIQSKNGTVYAFTGIPD